MNVLLAPNAKVYLPEPLDPEYERRFLLALERMAHELEPQKRALREASRVTAEDLAVWIGPTVSA